MSREILSRPPVAADRRIPYGSDPSQFVDLFLPANPEYRASAVMIHGGFWRSLRDVSASSHLCSALAKNGIVTANIEYRRVGTGGGWPQTFEDVLSGFRTARQNVASAPPVLIGHSAGGHLALRAAVDLEDLAGVVALAPVANLELAYREDLGDGAVAQFLGGMPDSILDVYEAADPIRHASNIARTIIFGTDDDVVPLSQGRTFVEARRSDRGAVKLIELPGGDHFDVIDPESQAFALVLASVLEYFER